MGKRSKRNKVKRKLETKSLAKLGSKRPYRPPTFRDNFGNTISAIELVFPIIRLHPDQLYETVGTGFFVHPSGGFVTAKHCLYAGEVYDDNCYAVQTVSPGEHFIRKIQYFESHPTADIGVGMLRGQLLHKETQEVVLKASFPISLTLPEINDQISTLAYPRMQIDEGHVGTFPCDRYVGKIVDYHADGTAWLRSGCYQTDMEIKSGASGGPVIRRNQIIGVNSTSMETAHGEEPISFITPVHFVFDLQLKDSDGAITSIKELMESGHMPFAK